jgi:uncharacterized membrane protein YhaH (DUF805 family)
VHDLWPAIRTGTAKAFRFGGTMNRASFWLWVGFLYVVASVRFLLDLHLVRWLLPRQSAYEGWWPFSLKEILQALPWAEVIYIESSAGWPKGLALTERLLDLKDWAFLSGIAFPLIYFLSFGAIVRRARDAGYSPPLTFVMLYWFVIGVAILAFMAFLFGSINNEMGWYAAGLSALYFQIHWAVSLIFAVIALYRLSSPSALERESS